MKRPEQTLHILCADYMRAVHPKVLWWHTPNSSKRGIVEAMRLRQMGVRPGTPDFVIVLPFVIAPWESNVAFIELKAEQGRQSPAQKEFEDAAAANNCPYKVCRSLDEFIATVNQWLS